MGFKRRYGEGGASMSIKGGNLRRQVIAATSYNAVDCCRSGESCHLHVQV